MSKAAKDAHVLLGLLSKYRDNCDLWEDHITQVIDGDFADKEEEEVAYKRLQTESSLPLMQECIDKGYKYVQLMCIMPPPCKTTYDERAEILEDIELMVENEYGRI